MTREEAIAYYKKNAIRIKGIMAEEDEAIKDRFFQTLEATEMAIQALEQESCSDVVSRQAAIDAFERFIHELGIEDEPYNYGEMALSVKNAPSVNPQERTGHWIDTDEWRETVDGFEQWGYFRKCSKCGYVFKFLEIDNFCPNCGARMESET